MNIFFEFFYIQTKYIYILYFKNIFYIYFVKHFLFLKLLSLKEKPNWA